MGARISWLVVFLLVVIGAAAFTSNYEPGAWYLRAAKPEWAPPHTLFSIAWSVLYVLMAFAMWRVWIRGHHARIGALVWWLIQLALHVAWVVLFFGINRTGYAMVELLLLIGVVSLCIKAFSTGSSGAASLMTPYLLWLIYMLALNVAIWLMNGGGTGIFYSD